MHNARDCKAKLRLWIAYRMAADQYRTCFLNGTVRTRNNTCQHFAAEFVGRKTDQVDADQWPGPHGEHVAERVGSTNAPEQLRIIKWRGNEIRSRHHGKLFRQAIDPRIVIGIEPDDEIRICRRRQLR